MGDLQCVPADFKDKDHLHVNVQRHWMGSKSKWRIMRKQFEKCCRIRSTISSRSLVVPGAWIREKVVRNLRWHTNWILDTNSRENASEHEKSGNPIFRCTRSLERRQFRSKEEVKDNYTFHSVWRECTVASENGNVRQSTQFLRSNSGYDSRITGRSSGSRETCCIRSDGTRNSYPTSYCRSIPSNDERQGNLLQDYEQRFERLLEDQKLSELCSEAGLILAEVGKFFHALPSPKEPKIRSLCREYAPLREDEEEHV